MLRMKNLAVLTAVLGLLIAGVPAMAQNTITTGGTTYGVDSGTSAPVVSPQKLQQMVAPIALYPDVLVTQILIACTYPTQVVEAYEWVQKNKTVTGDAAAAAVKDLGWDPSVQSLVQFPSVLDRMFQNLEWSQDLGEAFMQDKQGVMNTIQTMRQNAYSAGNLKTNTQQTVTQDNTTIVIQPSNPEIVYVPAYDPATIYGGWYPGPWYYPPAVYAPWVGWYPGAGAFAFGVGVAVGAAWSGAWGCDWAHGNVYVNNNYFHGHYGTEGAYHGADGSYRGANGSVGHYGNTTAAYNRNTGEVHSYNSATGVARGGQAYQGAYGEGVKGENGSVAHAGNTTASYNKNTGEMHSYNSATGNAHSGNANNYGGGYGGTDRGYGEGGGAGRSGSETFQGMHMNGGGGEAAASDRGWSSRGSGGGGGGGFNRGGGFGGGGGRRR